MASLKKSHKRSGRAITVEHLWQLARPSGVSLSPDFAHACVTVTRFDMDENKAQSSVWVMSLAGDRAEPLTACGERDGGAAWSPTGEHIAFVAKRNHHGKADEEAQLYLIRPTGGEATRVTGLATGVSGIKWFADGQRIAFISWVWPDLKTDKDQAKRLKERREDKVKAYVVEKDQYRYWDHWLADGRVPHLFVVDIATGKCSDVFAGTDWELWLADTDASHFDISPDGREITFATDLAKAKRLDHEQNLVTVELKSRKAKVLTAGSKLNHVGPRYSPDGKTIACVTHDFTKSSIDQGKLTLIDRKSGRLSVVSGGWDRDVQAPLQWADDGQHIYFCAEDVGRQHVWRWPVAVATQAPERVVVGGVVQEFALAGAAIAFIRHNISSPPRVFACAANGDDDHPIESINAGILKGVDLGDAREMTIKGARGDDVQMWVVYPPNFDPKKKWPLMHSIHGGPHTSFGDLWHFRWNSQVFASQGYVVALVNYHGSSSFGQAYLQSIDGQWGKLEFDDVEAGTDYMLKQGYIDKNRLFATGGSYGGKMVALMNGRTDRYNAYVCHAGCFDWVGMFADDAYFWHPKELGAFYWDDPKKVATQNPLTYVKDAKTPTLVIHGELDYRVPVQQGFAYYNTLRAKGVPARLVYFPDENHWILKPQNSRLWYKEFFEWLGRWHTRPKARPTGRR